VEKQLPARPNLDHLRGQAKSLLAQLKKGDDAAMRAFIKYLPAARSLTRAQVRGSRFRLADAQSVVARQAGFASWAVLARQVEQLRALEGEWRIARLEIDGNEMPTAATAARILIDGDRFRTESVEATYEGIFAIDTEASPPHFDLHFISGPEAGASSLGIYRLDGPDALTLCLGLVGSSRPSSFATHPGSGHALERLERSSSARPAHVDGGTPPPPPAPAPAPPRGAAASFAAATTPLLERLQGEWRAIELVTDGRTMPEAWLAHASRTMIGNEVKVVVGGQTMVHAKVRIDERASPIAVDYLDLSAKRKGAISYGIMEWIEDDVRFLMSRAGVARPVDFSATGTLSRWRRR
jgi:uncharacterized protein (TIGR03067 family)